LPDAIQRPEVQALIDGEIKVKLRDLASYEMPKKVLLLDADFSIESGELTPKLSIKRRVVEGRYKDRIDRLYEGAEEERSEPAEEVRA
jgi:long-chain acyl-CoA synthetase